MYEEKVSRYLDQKHFQKFIERLKKIGVTFLEPNTIEGVAFFVPDTEQLKYDSMEGTLHVKIMDPRIAKVFHDELKFYNFELRNELSSNCAAAHVTLVERKDMFQLTFKEAENLRSEFNYVTVKIELTGIKLFKHRRNYVAGIGVEVEGLRNLRQKLKLEPMSIPHVTCCFLKASDFDRKLKRYA